MISKVKTLPSDIHLAYKEKGGVLKKAKFNKVLRDMNELFTQELLQGKSIKLGHGVGPLYFIRVRRNFSRNTINWGASNAYKKSLEEQGVELYDKQTGKGEQWLIYYTDPFYVRLFWNSPVTRIMNRELFTFRPSRAERAPIRKLRTLLDKNPEAIYNYPLVDDVQRQANKLQNSNHKAIS